jgi:hypothetical protein
MSNNLWSSVNSVIGNNNSITTPLYGGSLNTQGAASTYSISQNIAPVATNVIQFTPANNSNFQFQATFDGASYNVIVTWNIYGERYYVNIYDLNNILIVALPLIGSPLNYNISLTAGYFTTQLVYRVANNQFEII